MVKRKRRRRRRGSPLPMLALVLVVIGLAAALAARTLREGTSIHRATAHIPHVAARPQAYEPPASTFVPAAVRAPRATETAAPVQPSSTPAPTEGAPKLALIIDDCGQWPDVERGFIALPI